jgi:hypothetical protein
MRLIQAEFSPHIRANVRLYESDLFYVDWQHTDGSHGQRPFPDEQSALDYFKTLTRGGSYEKASKETQRLH